MQRNATHLWTALPHAVALDQSSGDALRAMDAAGVEHYPIVDAEGRLAGITSRAMLENGCWGMGHDPDRCRVRNHVSADVAKCPPHAVPGAVEQPVVVVDRRGVPAGIVVPGSVQG